MVRAPRPTPSALVPLNKKKRDSIVTYLHSIVLIATLEGKDRDPPGEEYWSNPTVCLRAA